MKLPPTYLPYLSVAPGRVVENNVDTYLIYAYYDFGLAGVALLAFGLGAAATGLERAVRRPEYLGLVTAASIAATTVVMSFFGLSLVRDFRWIYLAVLALLVAPKLRPERIADPVDGSRRRFAAACLASGSGREGVSRAWV